MSTKNQETFIPIGVGEDHFAVSLVKNNEIKLWRRAQLPIKEDKKVK